LFRLTAIQWIAALALVAATPVVQEIVLTAFDASGDACCDCEDESGQCPSDCGDCASCAHFTATAARVPVVGLSVEMVLLPVISVPVSDATAHSRMPYRPPAG
jgi:hypothetical protein